MEKFTYLNSRKVVNNQVEALLVTVTVDNGSEIKRENHRVVIEPDTDIDATIEAVNNSLALLGRPAIASGELFPLKAFCESVHTEEVKAKWEKDKKEKAEQEKAEREAQEVALAQEESAKRKAFADAVAAAVKAELEKDKS